MIAGHRRTEWLLVAALAALWPFAFPDANLHRAGVQLLAVVLVGLSLTVSVGWLRVVSLFQPASVGAGAWATMLLFAGTHSLPLGLPLVVVAAALVGAAVAVVAWLPVLRRPRLGLALSSLLVTLAAWGLLSLVPSRPFQRPVFLGFDLAGDRTLYLWVLAGVVTVALLVENLRDTGVAARITAAAGAPLLAVRSGVDPRTGWLQGVALSGALAGSAGAVFALLDQGMPAVSRFTPAVGVGWLAVPLLGGPPWPSGAVAGALLLASAQALTARFGLTATTAAGLGLAVGAFTLPTGLLPLLWRRLRPEDR